MARLHLILGSVSLLAFLLSGAYLRFNVPQVAENDDLTRMMFRSNHIYILFVSLLNLLLGCCRPNSGFKKLFRLGSAALALGTIGLNIAFYVDPLTHSMQRNLTRMSVRAVAAGCVFVLIAEFLAHRTEARVKHSS